MVKKLVTVFVVVLLVGLVLLSLLILVRSPRRSFLQGELPTHAAIQSNEKLALLAQALPSAARDISYYIRPHAIAVFANFAIDKVEFEEWAVAQNWTLKEISVKRYIGSSPSPLCADMISVERGFECIEKILDKDNPNVLISDLEVIFDSDLSRCFYRYIGSCPPHLIPKGGRVISPSQ